MGEGEGKMNGVITTIQRMSIHDGPGIRSTVFLKGCNLRCKWCHNPETFSPQPELEWQQDRCQQCGACTEVCKTGALQIANGKVTLTRDRCTACFDCIEVCYPQALRKMGRHITPQQLCSELEKDRVFFDESGGGVTFSGGEPMMQAPFLAEAMGLLKEKGIHVALETNLSVPWDHYEKILPYTDLVMADLKIMDEEKHRKWTGSGNKRILDNILRLDRANVPYILRTPVVPGVNDSPEDMEKTAAFVARLENISTYELLPFHPMAESKYKNLGKVDPFKGVQALDLKKLESYEPILTKYKIS